LTSRPKNDILYREEGCAENMKTKKPEMEEKIDIGTPETLATEMYRELKKANKFKERIIVILCVIIGILIGAMCFQGWYHIHKWSEFDTVVVDTGEGGGNANYVQGDNQGGIFNGEGYSQAQESEQGQEQGDADKA